MVLVDKQNDEIRFDDVPIFCGSFVCTREYKKKINKHAGAASLNGGSSFDGGLDGLIGPCYSPCYSADIEGFEESGDDGLLVDNSSTCSSSTQAAPCSSAAGKLDHGRLCPHQPSQKQNKNVQIIWSKLEEPNNQNDHQKPVGV